MFVFAYRAENFNAGKRIFHWYMILTECRKTEGRDNAHCSTVAYVHIEQEEGKGKDKDLKKSRPSFRYKEYWSVRLETRVCSSTIKTSPQFYEASTTTNTAENIETSRIGTYQIEASH